MTITIAELKKTIRKLKKKKSPGPDGITNEMLTHLGNTALSKLLETLNLSLSWSEGKVPQIWREAVTIPTLKRGKNKAKAASYRPTSLTSRVCKTLERIINQRLKWYLDTNKDPIVQEQAGFRRFRSTEDQAACLSQVIEDAFQGQQVVLATFTDFQRALDKVWKDGLVVKLQRFGVAGNMCKWTKSYQHNRGARVMVDNKHSRKVLLRHGVPQGGVLSASLFVIFINDLVAELPKGVHAALYADDLVLWCSEEYATTSSYRMQLALHKVTAWAADWGVKINQDKRTATLFTLATKQQAGILKLSEVPLQLEEEQTYLGVTFDRNQTWKPHLQKAEAKARRKLATMKTLLGTTWGASENILKTVYQGVERPHLEYGSTAWASSAKSHLQNLHRVQNQALKIITGAMS